MYQALYRKWRPSTFAEVSGQPQVTLTLLNELRSGRISHAYLFTGSRGTGKTSCAKILAKAVNCLNPVDGEPCCECEICRAAAENRAPDIIEIDAASNNGVDNIRDIREEVNLTPMQGKYRVYIIDEVHMLSTGAFNALLKTLEEPPSHVIFILATTEVHKLPATVLSRCQRFDFKRIAPEQISARLQTIAAGEGVKLTDDAASLIARLADGGMRDAVSLLDRCCARGADIDADVVSSAAGIAGTKHLFAFSEYIASDNASGCIELVNRLHNESCDIESLCSELMMHYRNLMVAKTVKDPAALITAPADEINELKERASQYRLSKILACLDILSETAGSMKGAANKKILLESAVIRMCAEAGTPASSAAASADSSAEIQALKNKIDLLEAKINSLSSQSNAHYVENSPAVKKEEATPAPEAETKPVPAAEAKPAPMPAPAAKPGPKAEEEKIPAPVSDNPAPAPAPAAAPSQQGITELTRWPEVLTALQKKNMPLYVMLRNATASVKNGTHLVIHTDNTQLYRFFVDDNSNSRDLMTAVYNVLGLKLKIAIDDKRKTEKAKNPLENLKDKINTFNNN